MNYSAIQVGKVYAASNWGRPNLSTGLYKVKVTRKEPSPRGGQGIIHADVIGSIGGDWSVMHFTGEQIKNRKYKTGQFYKEWDSVEVHAREKHEIIQKKKQKEAAKADELTSSLARITEATGVVMPKPVGNDYIYLNVETLKKMADSIERLRTGVMTGLALDDLDIL